MKDMSKDREVVPVRDAPCAPCAPCGSCLACACGVPCIQMVGRLDRERDREAVPSMAEMREVLGNGGSKSGRNDYVKTIDINMAQWSVFHNALDALEREQLTARLKELSQCR
jgi:hypothetical protein